MRAVGDIIKVIFHRPALLCGLGGGRKLRFRAERFDKRVCLQILSAAQKWKEAAKKHYQQTPGVALPYNIFPGLQKVSKGELSVADKTQVKQAAEVPAQNPEGAKELRRRKPKRQKNYFALLAQNGCRNNVHTP